MVHLGIIPDGNRRWCKNNSKDYNYLLNHWLNNMIIKNICYFLDCKQEYKELNTITELSLYISSIDNITRDDKTFELGYKLIRLLFIIYHNCETIFKEKYRLELKRLSKNIKLNIIGDMELLPQDIQNILKYFQNILNNDLNENPCIINIAIAYDYKKDLLNEGNNSNNNYKREQGEIDIVFRSGSEKRISGFFPTKILYSELYFIDKLFPDITLDDIDNALIYLKTRNRRYGK